MRDVSIYEPSKSVSAFEQFPHKILFTNSEENGLWGIKIIPVRMYLLKLSIAILEKTIFI
jgi:hypothetical protein